MGTDTDTLIALKVRTWTQLIVILVLLMMWKMFWLLREALLSVCTVRAWPRGMLL